jgi:ABC-type Fe3+ transport system permease subunit
MAGAVLAVVLIVGLAAIAWIERRAASGHPVQLPDLPRIDVDLPLRGRAVLVGQAVIFVVSFLVVIIELAIVGLLQ